MLSYERNAPVNGALALKVKLHKRDSSALIINVCAVPFVYIFVDIMHGWLRFMTPILCRIMLYFKYRRVFLCYFTKM